MTNNFKLVFLVLILMGSSICQSLTAQNSYWTKGSEAGLKSERNNRKVHPESYQIFNLNLKVFKDILNAVPLSSAKGAQTGTVIEFPMPDGAFQKFSVTEAPIMQPELAAKFPEIKTYKAVGLDDKTATMRFSITPFGLHVFSLSGKRSSLFIDPYTTDGQNYMVYERSAINETLQDFSCLTEENIDLYSLKHDVSDAAGYANDKVLRTYRLALSCNAKYGAKFAGQGTDEEKKARIQAQMAVTINRVNEIYERDLAITLVFISRNDELIYYDVNNDPWGSEFNLKTQEVISTTLKDESLYDIGHNFNTSDGGSAGCIGCVCTDAVAPYTGSFSKGQGYTGTPNPVGDAFDIDYVAHEMGHQFGGYHTMNTCSRSGNGATEVEPASGSSIMGYAGICGETNNVQENSDAHFNYVNIRDITNNIQPDGKSSCGAQTALENVAPVANAGSDYVIPVSTPFVLTGTATDVNGTATLTYNWSQNDPEKAPAEGAPKSNWVNGPLYRSHLPTDSPSRYMPSLSDVIAGNLTPTWEVTPSVARTLNFAFTVRDNGSGFASGIGQTHADLMTVTVVDGTPFTVESLNESDTWFVNTSYKVRWNVGETNQAPINCAKVNIKLSLDGGYTYPVSLATNVDNNGEATVLIPDNPSTTCRIMVEAADNIFYDISNVDFAIARSEPMFLLGESDSKSTYVTCQDSEHLDVELDYTTVNGFTETTTFSVENLPKGVVASFNPETLTANGTTVLRLSNFSEAAIDVHSLSVIGTSNSVTKSADVAFTLKSIVVEAPVLLSPADGVSEVNLDAELTWESPDYAEFFEIEFSTVADFSTNVKTYKTTMPKLTVNNLSPVTDYYWRVKAGNECADSMFSEIYSFTTTYCTRCESRGDTAYDYQTSTTRVVFNTIDNASGKTAYSDFTNLSTTLNRGESYDLTVQANTSGNYVTHTTVWIDWNYNCSFDDEGEMYDLGTAENVVDGITSNAPFTITVPENAVLTDKMIMRVGTKYKEAASACEIGFDGEVEDYAIQVLPTLDVNDLMFEEFKVWPNPNAGTFKVSLTSDSGNVISVAVFDLSGRRVFYRSYSETNSFMETIKLGDVASGMYLLEVKDGQRSAVKKIVVE
ncbi:reprolysin-like metallopeptidase [Formosa sp. S-31]|uniref:reprolysin-like metallopeptidase n=1 Tax=Formosa sp. S-31 TaxID=2790949 RepID=UPI003EBA35F1